MRPSRLRDFKALALATASLGVALIRCHRAEQPGHEEPVAAPEIEVSMERHDIRDACCCTGLDELLKLNGAQM
jgi:hypothetical protein